MQTEFSNFIHNFIRSTNLKRSMENTICLANINGTTIESWIRYRDIKFTSLSFSRLAFFPQVSYQVLPETGKCWQWKGIFVLMLLTHPSPCGTCFDVGSSFLCPLLLEHLVERCLHYVQHSNEHSDRPWETGLRSHCVGLTT